MYGFQVASSWQRATRKPTYPRTSAAAFPSAVLPKPILIRIQIKELSHLKKSGKLQFKDARKELIAIPVSLEGFGDAYDALQE